MATSAQSRPVLRFDAFEVDLHAGEVRKYGRRIRLQIQPFQVLRMLLEHPGEIVSREELKQKLWRADTFVDFDDGLNTAVKKLRDKLSDSADQPRYIETIPRRGYRFIGSLQQEENSGATLLQESDDGAASEKAPARLVSGKRAALYWIVLGSAVALALLGASAGIYRSHSRHEAGSIRSIAVLPLDNLSGDPSQDYFAAGLTDALTTELARTVGSSLRVTSRSSAAKYKNKALSQIANELDVDAVIEGSVVKSGDRARITAQLINARADKHLWAASYDRDLQDILGLQSEIAATIARRVQVTLSPRAQARLRTAVPANPQAYDLYQRGRYHVFSNNRQDLASSIELLQHAVGMDPNLAEAHAVLARAYTTEAFWLQPEGQDWEVKAIDELNRALKLDPDLADGYLARGIIYWTHRNGFPHERAMVELKRALELDPNLAEAHHELGKVYLHIGLFDKAEQELRSALQLDPTNVGVRYRIAIVLLDQGRPEEARSGLEGTRAYYPELWSYQMALALYKLDRKQEAAALIREYLRQNPRDEGGVGNAMQALLYADAGQTALAVRSIQSAVQQGKDFGHFHHAAYTIGSAYALINRPKEAIRWLRAAAEDGFPCYPFYEHDAALQNIRSDPGFLELMSQMRSDWERRRANL